MRPGDLVRIGGHPRGSVICSQRIRTQDGMVYDQAMHISNETLAIMVGFEPGHYLLLVNGVEIWAPMSFVEHA